VTLESKDLREFKDRTVTLESKDLLEFKVLKAIQASKAYRESRV
jgi:hypothetical protein